MAIARKQAPPKKKKVSTIYSFKGNERKSKTSTIASDLVPLKSKKPLSYNFL